MDFVALGLLIEAAKELRDAKEVCGVSDYMKQYDHGLLMAIETLVEAVDDFEDNER